MNCRLVRLQKNALGCPINMQEGPGLAYAPIRVNSFMTRLMIVWSSDCACSAVGERTGWTSGTPPGFVDAIKIETMPMTIPNYSGYSLPFTPLGPACGCSKLLPAILLRRIRNAVSAPQLSRCQSVHGRSCRVAARGPTAAAPSPAGLFQLPANFRPRRETRTAAHRRSGNGENIARLL
jgi:hypothetical protein